MLKLAKLLLAIAVLLLPLAPVDSEAWVATRMRKRANLKGFFVLTKAWSSGALGGLTGANNTCLSDLQTYDWKGKTEATLNTSTVKAFLCDSSSCNNLLPNQTYYFAVSNQTTVGGANFTTDASGSGPGNSDNWGTTAYFGLPNYYFWSNRAQGADPIHWPSTPSTAHCSNWTSSSAGVDGYAGVPGATNVDRWNDNVLESCNSGFYLVCIVNPN